MNNGEIAQIGKYNDILVPGSAFIQLVGAQNAALCTLDSNKGKPVSDESPQHVEDSYNKSKSFVNGEADNEGVIGLPPAAQLVKEEEREKGSVGFSVYWKYITTAYGGALILLLILANILLQILQIGSTYWLAWAAPSSKNDESVSGSTLMIVYGSLAIGICVCTVIVNMLVLATGYNTATNFFRKMLQSIFHAPMSFFDATPTGRILNRVSYRITNIK